MRSLGLMATRLIPCNVCPAEPGQPCTSISGDRLHSGTKVHASRFNAAYAIWVEGHRDGVKFAVDYVARKCDPDRADLDPRGTLERALDFLRRWRR